MSEAFFVELAALLDGLASVGGCGLRWKDADLELRAATPSRLRGHEIPACRAAQRATAGTGACRRDCLMDDPWWRRRGTDELDRRCHRGLLEQLVRVRLAGAALGTVHVGPFADARSPDAPGVARLPHWDRERARQLAALAAQGLRLLAPLRERALLGLPASGDPELAAALHRIRGEARIDLQLRAIAAAIGWRPERLGRRLRGATGRSFSDLRADAVLARAQRLLADAHPVSEIAAALGYRHHTHFTQAFRRAAGVTPSAWRDAQANEPA